MLIFVPVSALLIWLFSAPIHLFTTTQDLRLNLNGVEKTKYASLEYFETNHCETKKNCHCVLLVHGLGDSAYTWAKTLSADKDSWSTPVHLYAVNLPGSSKSPKLNDPKEYQMDLMADKVFTPIKDQCESWDLVGNSFGGWLVSKIALKHPDKTRSLSLLGSAGLDLNYDHILPMFTDPTIDSVKKFQSMAYAKPQALPTYVYSELVERMKNLPIIDMMKAQAEGQFIDKGFPSIKKPIYLLWGEEDKIIPMNFALRFKELNPSAKLEVAKDCGHLPQKECFSVFQQALNNHLLGI